MASRTTLSHTTPTAESAVTKRFREHFIGGGRKRRSCLVCSRRKVKCDKQKPCTSCVKSGIECVFPITAPNRPKAETAPELTEMLQRLEKAVQSLGHNGVNSFEAMPTSGQDPLAHGRSPQINTPPSSVTTATLHDAVIQTGVEIPRAKSAAGVEKATQATEPRREAPSVSSTHEKSPGMIVRDHGRDTYVRRWFWSNGTDTVRENKWMCLESC